MKRFLLAFGTRPEAIKMAPLIKEFKKHDGMFETIVCVTAQHRALLDQVLKFFDITPDYDLDVMTTAQDLYETSTKILFEMRGILAAVKPDVVFVHGDTTTSFVVALAAFYQKITVAHIEAGLRTNDISSPFPEEMYRQLTARIARFHFAPTEISRNNLLAENISDENITVTGNTVIDALNMVRDKITQSSELRHILQLAIEDKGYEINGRKYIIVTGHRRENFGLGLLNICEAVKRVAEEFPAYDLIFSVHPNPNVEKPVKDQLRNISNVFLLPPLDYLPFIYLVSKAVIVVTDSGSIQEEAPCFGVPLILLRTITDRPEVLSFGSMKLVGTDVEKIVAEITMLLRNEAHYRNMSHAADLFGDGKASERIVSKFL